MKVNFQLELTENSKQHVFEWINEIQSSFPEEVTRSQVTLSPSSRIKGLINARINLRFKGRELIALANGMNILEALRKAQYRIQHQIKSIRGKILNKRHRIKPLPTLESLS